MREAVSVRLFAKLKVVVSAAVGAFMVKIEPEPPLNAPDVPQLTLFVFNSRFVLDQLAFIFTMGAAKTVAPAP